MTRPMDKSLQKKPGEFPGENRNGFPWDFGGGYEFLTGGNNIASPDGYLDMAATQNGRYVHGEQLRNGRHLAVITRAFPFYDTNEVGYQQNAMIHGRCRKLVFGCSWLVV